MHFKTLVTVYMPTVEEDPHENAAVRQSIELLQAQKDELAKNLYGGNHTVLPYGKNNEFCTPIGERSRRSYDTIQYRTAGRIHGIC